MKKAKLGAEGMSASKMRQALKVAKAFKKEMGEEIENEGMQYDASARVKKKPKGAMIRVW